MLERQMSRRDFLKALAITAGVFVLEGGFHELDESFSLDWLNHPDRYTFRPIGPLPPQELRGVHVNSPFLYVKEDTLIDKYLADLGPQIRGIRIFIDDRFEKTLGTYNKNLLPRITAIAEKLHRTGKTISVDLLDGFTIKIPSWNPMYPENQTASPYVKDGIHKLYTDDRYIDAYINRVNAIAPTLRHLPNLAAVTVMNEPPPDPDEKSLSNWYRRVTPVVAEAIPGVSVLSGVADPRTLTGSIPGLTATTAHVYPETLLRGGLRDEFIASPIPVIIQECGVPDHLCDIHVPVDHDALLSAYLQEMIFQTTETDIFTHEVKIGSSTFDLWKFDAYNDSFTYNPQTDLQCNKLLSVVSAITTNVLA